MTNVERKEWKRSWALGMENTLDASEKAGDIKKMTGCVMPSKILILADS